jgi:hypothetical protein
MLDTQIWTRFWSLIEVLTIDITSKSSWGNMEEEAGEFQGVAMKRKYRIGSYALHVNTRRIILGCCILHNYMYVQEISDDATPSKKMVKFRAAIAEAIWAQYLSRPHYRK